MAFAFGLATTDLRRIYLDGLVSKGYLDVNGEGNPVYQCTPAGNRILGAYDRLLESGFVTEDDMRGIYLAMLRGLGDASYEFPVINRSRSRIRERLIEQGLVGEGGLTTDGRQVFKLAADLFVLADYDARAY